MSSSSKPTSVLNALAFPDLAIGGGAPFSATVEGSTDLPELEDLLPWLDQILPELQTARMAIAASLQRMKTQAARIEPREVEDKTTSEMLTAKEAAAELKVKPSTIKRWCRRKKFPGAKSLGKSGWRIPRDAVESYEQPIQRAATRLRRVG